MAESTHIKIGDRLIGSGEETFLIAEVGLAHEGSLGMAHSYIDAAATTGVDAIKFQTHVAEAESTAAEKFRVRVFPQDETRMDYWRRTAFEAKQWRDLAAHARDNGLFFLSSPFSLAAVEILESCDVPAWKVASGELNNEPLLDRMCATGKPLLISSGMSSWFELDRTIELVRNNQSDFALFQCTTAYPCPPEQWGLNVLDEMRQRYRCPIGLSDHSGTTTPGIAAVAQGASMLEFHIAFSNAQFGPDARASLTIERTAELVQAIRQLDVALGHPLNKDEQAKQLEPLHRLFTKSIVAARDLSAGTVLSEADLAMKKPGDGLPSCELPNLVGRTLRHPVQQDQQMQLSDLE